MPLIARLLEQIEISFYKYSLKIWDYNVHYVDIRFFK